MNQNNSTNYNTSSGPTGHVDAQTAQAGSATGAGTGVGTGNGVGMGTTGHVGTSTGGSGGTGDKIKGAVQVVQGIGENIRGSVLGAIEKGESKAKYEQIAEKGRLKIDEGMVKVKGPGYGNAPASTHPGSTADQHNQGGVLGATSTQHHAQDNGHPSIGHQDQGFGATQDHSSNFAGTDANRQQTQAVGGVHPTPGEGLHQKGPAVGAPGSEFGHTQGHSTIGNSNHQGGETFSSQKPMAQHQQTQQGLYGGQTNTGVGDAQHHASHVPGTQGNVHHDSGMFAAGQGLASGGGERQHDHTGGISGAGFGHTQEQSRNGNSEHRGGDNISGQHFTDQHHHSLHGLDGGQTNPAVEGAQHHASHVPGTQGNVHHDSGMLAAGLGSGNRREEHRGDTFTTDVHQNRGDTAKVPGTYLGHDGQLGGAQNGGQHRGEQFQRSEEGPRGSSGVGDSLNQLSNIREADHSRDQQGTFASQQGDGTYGGGRLTRDQPPTIGGAPEGYQHQHQHGETLAGGQSASGQPHAVKIPGVDESQHHHSSNIHGGDESHKSQGIFAGHQPSLGNGQRHGDQLGDGTQHESSKVPGMFQSHQTDPPIDSMRPSHHGATAEGHQGFVGGFGNEKRAAMSAGAGNQDNYQPQGQGNAEGNLKMENLMAPGVHRNGQ